LLSKCTEVTPDFNATPERWLSFLAETTDGDEDLQRYLQKLVGYALAGSPQEQTLHFIHGPPLTGKSVFISTVSRMLGSYYENVPIDTFASSSGSRHPTDLAKLAGARMVTASETEEGRAWDVARIKNITGSDTISARFMRQDFFDFTPTFTIIIVGNHEPEIRGADYALMRRLHIIPFEHTPGEVDRLLSERLREEWPAILAWAVRGCHLWLEEGLDAPEAVQYRTEKYRQEEDPVGLFIEDECVTDGEGEVTRQDLYTAWLRWCHGQGEHPGTLKQMKRRFAAAESRYGFRDAFVGPVNSRARGYQGLRLKHDNDFIITEDDNG
jgi:putative DNA primase/helicase